MLADFQSCNFFALLKDVIQHHSGYCTVTNFTSIGVVLINSSSAFVDGCDICKL